MHRNVLQPCCTAILLGIMLSRPGISADAPDTKPELKKAISVAAEYYLSLPKGWHANTSWPILVTIDGSGHNFSGNCQSFIKARGSLPFVIVTPCVSSNGNDPADLKAVLAIVEEVRKCVNGAPTFFITGFSAGGHLAWQCVFTHPELLAGAAPAAANFRFRGVSEISKAPERAGLPVHAFLGDRDAYRPALLQQWEDAEKLARANGYQALTLTKVPDASHQPFADKVIACFAAMLPTKRD